MFALDEDLPSPTPRGNYYGLDDLGYGNNVDCRDTLGASVSDSALLLTLVDRTCHRLSRAAALIIESERTNTLLVPPGPPRTSNNHIDLGRKPIGSVGCLCNGHTSC